MAKFIFHLNMDRSPIDFVHCLLISLINIHLLRYTVKCIVWKMDKHTTLFSTHRSPHLGEIRDSVLRDEGVWLMAICMRGRGSCCRVTDDDFKNSHLCTQQLSHFWLISSGKKKDMHINRNWNYLNEQFSVWLKDNHLWMIKLANSISTAKVCVFLQWKPSCIFRENETWPSHQQQQITHNALGCSVLCWFT